MMIKTTMTFVTADNRRQQTPTVIFHNQGGFTNHRRSRYYGNHRRGGQAPNNLADNVFKKTIKGFLNESSTVCIITDAEETKKLTLAKRGRTYFVNGDKMSFVNLCRLVKLIILKMNHYKDSDEIDDEVCDFLDTPVEIIEAFVNKIKYKFISSDGDIEETLLDIERIGQDSVAIQFYTDLWVEMKNRHAVMFIRSCNGGSNRYSGIPFQELYFTATGEHLTISQEKVVEAFMIQNKSSTLVTKRSMELVEKLHKTFPNVYPYVQTNGAGTGKVIQRGLYIRGPGCSWVVSSTHDKGQHVLGRQDVGTAHLGHSIRPKEEEVKTLLENDNTDGNLLEALNPWLNRRGTLLTDGHNLYYRTGSICIDQAEQKISLGDQIASRTMLLMNDVDNLGSVSTLRGYEKNFGKERNKEVLADGVFSLREIAICKDVAIKWLKGEYLL